MNHRSDLLETDFVSGLMTHMCSSCSICQVGPVSYQKALFLLVRVSGQYPSGKPGLCRVHPQKTACHSRDSDEFPNENLYQKLSSQS